jgi:lipopolysaccharide export system protein LptC
MASWAAKTSLLCAVATAGCWPSRPPDARQVLPELRMEGVRYRVYRGSQSRLQGEADRTSYRRDTTEVVAHGLALILTDVAGATPVRVTAPVGQGIGSERVFSVEGGVRAVRADDLATTERARYAPATPGDGAGLVRGDDPVHLEGPGYQLDGTGFTLDPATGEFALFGKPRFVGGLPNGAHR